MKIKTKRKLAISEMLKRSMRVSTLLLFLVVALAMLSSCSKHVAKHEIRNKNHSVKAVQKTDSPLILIDFVVLNEGFGLQDRTEYEKHVRPIAAKYGMKMEHSYDLTQYFSGQLKGATKLTIWEFPNKGVLKQLKNDPEYIALAPLRDKIHNMEALTLYFAEPILNFGQLRSDHIFLDLVVMNKGYGAKERHAYEKAVFPITSKYGMERTHSFKITKFLTGLGPKGAYELNLWEVSDTKKMNKLFEDPKYQALIDYRNKIHNMEVLTMYMAKPGR